MDAIVDYFSSLEHLPLHRGAYLFGGLFFFFCVENTLPLFKASYNKTKHSGLNIFFTITTIVINFVMAFMLAWTAIFVEANSFGILNWMGASVLISMTLGLLLMDFVGAWLAHYIEHHITWMWQFHVIHHTDQNVDTTTGNRHHPGESVIRFLFTIAAVLIVGAPIWLVFMYQTISVILTQFNHSNVKMPSWLDTGLRLVICTPNMHRVHHHYRQPYSDSNYGNIFSFWDRIFGTYVIVDNSKLIYGVDTYMDKEITEDIVALLKLPFQGHQDHITYKDKEEL